MVARTAIAAFFLPAILAAQAVSSLANTDANYHALRTAAPQETYRVENIELKRDAATITLRTGEITFLAPALGRVTMAVFSGEGRFQLKPAIPIEEDHLTKLLGHPEVDETFDSAMLCFTDGTLTEVQSQAKTIALDPRAAGVLADFRHKLKEHAYSNIDADLLSELYRTPQGLDRNPSFRAFLHGKTDGDLRFLIVPSGASPNLPSPEEVELMNVDPVGERAGIWYLSHLASEWKSPQGASSIEDRRVAAAEHYEIETVIAGNGEVAATTQLRFVAKTDGARMIPFELLPNLRVARVSQGGRELSYIQEPVKEDPFFYVILPEPMVKGRAYNLSIVYAGAQVIHNQGSGNFSVRARENWYPSLNPMIDRATYDLVFKFPKPYTLVSVGKLVKEWQEDNRACSQWKSDAPLAVAGFNYGAFKKKMTTDKESKYEIEAYATPEVPDNLVPFTKQLNLTPSAMADSALVDGQNSIRLFEHWFGAAPYGRIAITQQPEFNFGQSWPTLVYLPMSAFLDSTQRWALMGQQAFRFADFIQEVTPHEVSHQWWGHMVGWATYHDQWLSEGFAEFSAGLFVEATSKPAEVDKFWDRLRDEIVQKNPFGNAPNDAGPVWLGERLNTFKTQAAYNRLVYPKGAYFLQMLRMLMRDEKTGDQDFIALMHDYVQTYLYKNASTEGFKAVVDKHMKAGLDAVGDHRSDWLFRDWIYGTGLPRYHLDYTLKNTDGGQVVLEGKLTQSEVPPDFLMTVPLYFDFDGHWVMVGRVRVLGSATANVKVTLPKVPKRVALNANHDLLAVEASVKKL
jgi:Peptidase family M1 domain